MAMEKGKRLLLTVTEPEEVAVVPEIEGWSDVKPESVVDVMVPEGVSESDRRDILVKLEHHKYVFVRGVNEPEKAAPPEPARWSTTILIGTGLCCFMAGCSVESLCIYSRAMELSSFALMVCMAVAISFLNPKIWRERAVELASEATLLIIAGKLRAAVLNFLCFVEMVVNYGKSWAAGDAAHDNAPPPT